MYDGTLESLEERFAKHAGQGGVGESGGCTDASVRLSTLLKVIDTEQYCPGRRGKRCVLYVRSWIQGTPSKIHTAGISAHYQGVCVLPHDLGVLP